MGMGVAAGAAVRGIDGFECGDFGWGEDDRGIQAARPIAGLGQLHDDHRRARRNGCKLDEAIGGLNLAVLDL